MPTADQLLMKRQPPVIMQVKVSLASACQTMDPTLHEPDSCSGVVSGEQLTALPGYQALCILCNPCNASCILPHAMYPKKIDKSRREGQWLAALAVKSRGMSIIYCPSCSHWNGPQKHLTILLHMCHCLCMQLGSCTRTDSTTHWCPVLYMA